MCNNLFNILKGTITYQDNCEDFEFTRSKDMETLCQIENEEECSDEDQYTHSIENGKRYKSFEDAKELYVLFVTQLISYYQEIKIVSAKLRYLCSTIFRTGQYKRIEVESTMLHLGLFYDIILSETSLFYAFTIAYKGLRQYSVGNAQAKIIFHQLIALKNEKKNFGVTWQEKWRALSLLIEPCTNVV